jgi:UDP-N-acetyl-2-amino-2-deoxyglucuronate dehydrogenase
MLKFALLGCGRIAKKHSELLGGSEIKNASLVAVCDIKKEKAKKIGDQYKVPYYTDMDIMMRNESIDVVSILTESGNHAKHVINLAKYGKHLVVEKPMALRLDDVNCMIKACETNFCKIFVVKQNRFNVPVQKLREALEKNRFGKLVLGTVRVRWKRDQAYYDQDKWRGTWALDGGVLANQASHHIDMLEWMMGDVLSVFAKANTSLVNIETEDTAVVILKFKNGALGIIEATTAARPEDLEGSISILGENGTVVISGFALNEMQTWSFEKKEDGDNMIVEQYSVNPPNVYGFGHKAYYDHIVDCIINKKKPLVDGVSGKKSLEIITAIYESIESGKEIFLGSNIKKSKLGRSTNK